MIRIDDKVVSFEILEEYFCCDYETCKGACCIEGDAGAPITPEEGRTIERLLPRVADKLSPEALATIEAQGISYRDPSNELVTSIVNGKDCVFTTYTSDGSCMCALEVAHSQGQVRSSFVKPISCRLYPIRVTRYPKFSVLNYDRWSICSCARRLGQARGIRVYEFLRTPIEAAFGVEFYAQLCEAARLLEKERMEQ